MNVHNCSKDYRTSPLSVSIKRNHRGPDVPAMNFLEDGNQFVLDCLTNMQAMELIGEEWQHLEQNCNEPYIYFQSYDWCYQWCKNFALTNADQSTPCIKIYILHRNGELVMVWPMMVTTSARGFSRQTFLSEPHGQYGNIICNRKLLPVDVGKRIWRHIRKYSNVDVITLDQYPQSSFLKQIIDGSGMVESSERHSSILDLEAFETWDEYKASFSRKMRKKRNQRRNKLAKQGDINYEVHYGGSVRYRELVALALQWKQVWLHETGRRATALSQNQTEAFLSELNGDEGEENEPPNGAVVGALTLNCEPIAIEIGMSLDGHYYAYLGAFDWQQKNFSPGKIQMEETQCWAKQVALRKFDLLGEPANYKTTWTNSTGALESRSIVITPKGFLYCVFWKTYIRPATRMIFNKLNADYRSKLLGFMGLRIEPALNN